MGNLVGVLENKLDFPVMGFATDRREPIAHFEPVAFVPKHGHLLRSPIC
jgi:hypothetical protein